MYCRPRCEKRVAEYCDSKGYIRYLPLVNKTHRYGKRVRAYSSPVFAGYVFVYSDISSLAHLRQHQRVANVLDVRDQMTLVTQLEHIKTALDLDQAFELMPHLSVGMKAIVQAGPLKGIEGFVVQLKNKTRIVLNIDLIQRAMAIEIDAECLLPI